MCFHISLVLVQKLVGIVCSRLHICCSVVELGRFARFPLAVHRQDWSPIFYFTSCSHAEVKHVCMACEQRSSMWYRKLH